MIRVQFGGFLSGSRVVLDRFNRVAGRLTMGSRLRRILVHEAVEDFLHGANGLAMQRDSFVVGNAFIHHIFEELGGKRELVG